MRSLARPSGALSYQTLVICSLIFCLFSPVVADTEIRNFKLPLPPSARSIHPSTEILDLPTRSASGDINHNTNVSTDHPERWYSFTPDAGIKSWTVRLSWPGPSPTKFNLEVLPSPEDDNIIIHISASQLSPRFPRHPFLSAEKGGPGLELDNSFFTPLAITIEPLLLGVLPKSTVPALGWILVSGLGAASTVPSILRYLNRVSAMEEPIGSKDK